MKRFKKHTHKHLTEPTITAERRKINPKCHLTKKIQKCSDAFVQKCKTTNNFFFQKTEQLIHVSKAFKLADKQSCTSPSNLGNVK